MTGFGPGGMDCDEVLADVYLYLDDESDVDARQRIRAHLDDCAPCLRQFGLEQDVKSLVARSCGGDIAPASLQGPDPGPADPGRHRDHATWSTAPNRIARAAGVSCPRPSTARPARSSVPAGRHRCRATPAGTAVDSE